MGELAAHHPEPPFRLDGAHPEVTLDEPAGVHESAVAFRPNGRQLAVGHANGSVSMAGTGVRSMVSASSAVGMTGFQGFSPARACAT